MNEIKTIRNDIPIGRENAVSREQLSFLWNCTGREVRAQIASLRNTVSSDGYAILSSTAGTEGYWRSDNPVEIKQYLHEMEARAKSTFRAMKEAKSVLRQKG